MVDILVTNDDGYESLGLKALVKVFSKDFSVVSVAPSSDKSWIGKSITKATPIVLKTIKKGSSYNVSGTPADCVQMGLYNVLKNKPKFVVSGINIGINTGYGFILSSGTVGAAMEASIDGVKAVSTSIDIPVKIRSEIDFSNKKNAYIFDNAAKITLKLVHILEKKEFDKEVDLISINIPYNATINTKMVVTIPYKKAYGQLFYKKGKYYIHKVPNMLDQKEVKGTDTHAVNNGYISITPINLELVSHNAVKKFRKELTKEWNKKK